MKLLPAIFANKSISWKTRCATGACVFLLFASVTALIYDYFWLHEAVCMVEASESDAIIQGGAYQMKMLEKQVARFGWSHADSFPVMHFGDEHWMELLMPYVDRRDYIDCSGDHRDEAMSFITCHAPMQRSAPDPFKSDAVENAKFVEAHVAYWNQWWQVNRGKKQWEWVQSGLSQWGLTVERPVTSQNIRDILLVLGRQRLFAKQQSSRRFSKNGSSPTENLGDDIKREEILPSFVLHNAARWLIDFGGLENLADSPTLANWGEQERLLIKFGIRAYEDQRIRGIRTRPSLDEGLQFSNEDRDRELWKEHSLVLAERILIPTAIILMLVSSSILAWIGGYFHQSSRALRA